jgi:parallel beta-helix repeat protein
MKKTNQYLEFIFSNSIINFLILTIFIFSLQTGCKKDSAPVQSRQDAQVQTNDQLIAKYGLPDIVVDKGSSIQDAVDKAKNGAIIFIEPGTYKESVTISKPGIKLIGKFSLNGNAVIIKNPGDEEDGISVTDNGDGFVLVNVTVRDFEENGVFLDSVDNFIISAVRAINDGEYGIFPVHCSHGLLEFCIATGCSDTGIYVGQSWDVKMYFNTAYANVNGLEIENSSDVDVAFNQSFNNVAGIFVDLLPGKDIKTSTNVHVRLNHCYNNNHINFGDTDELESSIPTGIGILVLGTDQTIIENNTVTGNDFTGIVVFSTLVLSVIADVPPEEILADIEPNPDGDRITRNTLKNNGANPPEIPDLPLPGVDLLWDGSGTNNCWSDNTFTTSAPSPLPSCN